MKCSIVNRQIDGGYGWLVVVSSFLIQLVMDGIVYSFGNLLIELLEEFGEERLLTSLAGSVLHGLQDMTGLFAAVLCDRFGCRIVAVSGALLSCTGFVISTFATSIYHLWVSYGFIGGLGFGLTYLAANVSVIKHFNKYRGLANGISLCGAGAGTFVLNNLTRYLIDNFGWRGCVLLEAGLCLQCVVFALFLLPPTDDEQEVVATCGNNSDENRNQAFSNNEICTVSEIYLSENSIMQAERESRHGEVEQYSKCKSLCSSELLKDKRFLIMLLSTDVVFLAFAIPFNYTADLAVESGLSKYEGSWLASSIGISNAAGRIIFGWAADRQAVNRKILFMVLLLLAGVSTALSIFLTTFYMKMVYTCFFGLSIGGYFSLLFLLLTDTFGLELVSKSIGFLLFTCGIVLSVASPIGGLLYDWTGSYNLTFILAGSEFVIGGLLIMLLKPLGVNRIHVLS